MVNTTNRVVARYVKSKVAPLYLDQERLKRWFEHIMRDKVTDDIIISGNKDEMVLRVNSEKRGHSVFKLRFDIMPDLTGIQIIPKIIAVK